MGGADIMAKMMAYQVSGLEIDLFCEDDEVVSRKTFLPKGITERNEIMLSESHVASTIVARKVKRSQFKFFDLRVN